MSEQTNQLETLQTFHTLPSEAETPFSVMTEPKATCTLSLGEGTTPIQLDADDNGVVRFHVTSQKQWKPLDLSLSYARASGGPVQHTLSLRDTSHTGPFAPNEIEGPPAAGTLRPALEGDPMVLSNVELVAMGYPPRPSPTGSPNRYADWLKIVSEPFTAVNPRLVERPNHRFGGIAAQPSAAEPGSTFNASFSTWAGAYLTNPLRQFYSIEGSWYAPKVLPPPSGYAAAAEWVGLDNAANDLYQAGTDSEVTQTSNGIGVTNYWAWIERLPFAPSSVPNLSVSPKDSVRVQLFVADAHGQTWFLNQAAGNGGLSALNTSVWLMIYNLTKKQSYWGTLPMAATTLGGKTAAPFSGRTAEFIVERPGHNGTTAALAFFGTINMQGCGWGDSFYGDSREFSLPPDTSPNPPSEATMTYLNMVNGNDTLCLVNTAADPTLTSRQEVVFNWQRNS